MNGDDPEACVWAAKLAIGFRQQFKVDVMIDLWCYRRHGHNEADEPSFTQPLMYREIAEHQTTRQIYAERLLEEGRLAQADLDEMKQIVLQRLDTARELAKEVKPRQKLPSFGGVWKGLGRPALTGPPRRRFRTTRSRKLPSLSKISPPISRRIPSSRRFSEAAPRRSIAGKGIDWGCAEMLAIGSLLLEGRQVRLPGRTSSAARSAIAMRCCTITTRAQYIPLQPHRSQAGPFHRDELDAVEFAVLGFEWGFASADPRNLVMWEAQFGDFVNGAQPMIDQIIAAAESKWRYMNGIVMLLPHGYEGQGPEHSNAYVERFLSLCAENNMQVIIPSTPAQYFHALRRQMHRKFRKPLIAMMPKSMFRDPAKSSSIEEFTDRIPAGDR